MSGPSTRNKGDRRGLVRDEQQRAHSGKQSRKETGHRNTNPLDGFCQPIADHRVDEDCQEQSGDWSQACSQEVSCFIDSQRHWDEATADIDGDQGFSAFTLEHRPPSG